MTAFLFIPATTDGRVAQRVDLAKFASLFADVEEPLAVRARGALVARILAMLLVLVLAIGDTVLIAKPDALTHAPTSAATSAVAPATSL